MSVSKTVGSFEPFEKMLTNGKYEVKEYQKEGIRWMIERETDDKIKGGILADEMGLGKTIQILGTMLCNGKHRTLIVLPVTLIQQWYDTILKLTGHNCCIVHGNNKPVALGNKPIVITSYSLLKLNQIQEVSWDRVVCDEAHHLRNPKSKKNEYLISIKRKITWFVTGTPIQNKTKDLKTLLSLLGLNDDHMKDLELCKSEFLLKRTKQDVNIKLPDISHHTINVDWCKDSHEVETASALHNVLSFNNFKGQKNNAYDRWVNGMLTDYSTKLRNPLLPLYIKCKQLCTMPTMMKTANIYSSYDDIDIINESIKDTKKVDSVVDHILHSSKSIKKMVFCNFHEEMDYIKTRCISANITAEIIDGRKSMSKKASILSNVPDVLILQIKTCCEGLNLQSYNRIYFVSPQWNPSIEDQAIARCHRIGQDDNVDIFKFKMSHVCNDMLSLDNYIEKVQEKKREIYI